MPKPVTNYATVPKNPTPYAKGSPAEVAAQWLLNSAAVTLNSTIAYLNGFFTASVPNQLSSKPATPYEAV